MPTPCHWLEATDTAQVRLRRYTHQLDKPCEANMPWGHDATSDVVAVVPLQLNDDGSYPHVYPAPEVFDGNAAWPVACSKCAYLFQLDDVQQVVQSQLYKRSDNGALVTLEEATPGAMWDASWMPANWRGPDGIALCVKLPGGHTWHVDSEANNCTRKGEPHQCWVRHGDPRQPSTLTVDKQGDTCAAGAGSVQYGQPGQGAYYHGFLQAGQLTDHLG